MVLPRELHVLIDLCRHDLGVGADRAVCNDVDAAALVKLAEAHRLTAVAARSWQALASRSLAPAPPAILCDAAARARQRSLFAAGHLARLALAFKSGGVTWRALKGPALSLQLHGDATIRMVRDLDVIVPNPQLGAAVDAAASAGWSASPHWRELSRITGRYDMELRPTLKGQPLLELHSALGPGYAHLELDPFAEDASGAVTIAGVAIPTLVGDARATYVAWHGARGLWYRLAWLIDYARLLPPGEDEAGRLLETARRCRAECAVRAGALFAHRLLGLPLPPWPAASPAMFERVETVVRWSFDRLSLGVEAPSVWSPPGSHRWLWREVAQQQHRWRAAIGALGHLARPTEQDALALGVHLPLAAHRLARPLFIARRWLRHDGRRG